jgi:mRNA interferase HigB
MKITDIGLILDFANEHADARTPLEAWLAEVRDAQWESPNDIKARHTSASFLSDNRVVFNIKGNRYRLLVQISYRLKVVFIKRIGTHAEYSKWKL